RYVKAQFNTATGFESTVRLFYDNGSSTYSTSPLGDPRRAFGELFPSPDFNGDGKTDLWSLTVEQFAEPGVPILTVFTWKQLISTGSAFVAGSWIGRENHSPTPRSLDVNGDGNMDAVFVMDGTWQLRISEGDGTDVEVDTGIVPGRPWLQPQNFLIADYDGDGRDDLLDYKTIDGWRLMRSTGTTLAQPVLLGNVLPINVRIADFNGDGMADLLTPEGTTSYWSSWLRNGAYPGLVNSVTDGLGVQTTISYASTAAGAVHTPSSNAAFPLIRDFTGPMQVVSQVTAADGIGTNYIQSYTYQGAKLHTQGRGFLGFGEMAVSDSRNGLKTKRKFFLNFPYTGMLQEQTLATGPNVTLAQTVNTASVFGYGAGESLRYFPFTDTTTARDYELNGALVRTTVNSWTYTSDYGNLQDSVSDVYGTDGGVFSTTVHREFVNNPANWCLGLVSFEELTRTAPSQPPQTRSRTAVPDSTSCRITSETSLPGTAQQVVTGYGYDTWGNVNTVSVTGYNVTTRTTTGSYAPDGYHRRSETNAENHVTAFAWDLGKGAVTSITDPNGLVTTLQRDGFGRLTREIRPDATATEIAREWCTLGCGLTLGKYQVTTRLKTWPAGVVASSSAAIFDPFDRPLRAISNLLGGALSYVDTEYDALGRLDSRSAPYKPGEAEYSSSYDYDLLNRVTLENHPMSEAQGSGRQVVYTYS
ncbi:MAG: toxin TcdB middle/N-terminal domain-containing protein, partial [Burkholderiales bacterium]